MAKIGYIGVNGVARKIKKMYIGVNGVAKEVKKVYVGVAGAAKKWFESAWTLIDTENGYDVNFWSVIPKDGVSVVMTNDEFYAAILADHTAIIRSKELVDLSGCTALRVSGNNNDPEYCTTKVGYIKENGDFVELFVSTNNVNDTIYDAVVAITPPDEEVYIEIRLQFRVNDDPNDIYRIDIYKLSFT